MLCAGDKHRDECAPLNVRINRIVSEIVTILHMLVIRFMFALIAYDSFQNIVTCESNDSNLA